MTKIQILEHHKETGLNEAELSDLYVNIVFESLFVVNSSLDKPGKSSKIKNPPTDATYLWGKFYTQLCWLLLHINRQYPPCRACTETSG